MTSGPPALAAITTQQQTQDFRTFDIIRATQYGALDRCIELIETKQVDVNQPDAENVCVLHWAAINNRIDIVK